MKEIKIYQCGCGGYIEARINRTAKRRQGRCEFDQGNNGGHNYVDHDLTAEERYVLELEERIDKLERGSQDNCYSGDRW